MDALYTLLQAAVLIFLAVWLVIITAVCSALFVAACWDIVRGRLPLQPPAPRPVRRHRPRSHDELGEYRARRHHPSTTGRAG